MGLYGCDIYAAFSFIALEYALQQDADVVYVWVGLALLAGSARWLAGERATRWGETRFARGESSLALTGSARFGPMLRYGSFGRKTRCARRVSASEN